MGFLLRIGPWPQRMLRIWEAVKDVTLIGGSPCAWVESAPVTERYRIDAGMLNAILAHGHPSLIPSDDPPDVIAAMVRVRDTLNSDPDLWPESWGYTEEEWEAEEAEGRERLRAMASAPEESGEDAGAVE